jgi:DNA/RNA-binding domain of Phe-tRNA-synthetase-like protein
MLVERAGPIDRHGAHRGNRARHPRVRRARRPRGYAPWVGAGRFVIHPQVFQRLPGMRVATAVALGLGEPPTDVGGELGEAWRGAAAEGARYGNAQSHPRVAPWRRAFRAMGVHPRDYPSSIEALLRRAMKGGEPFRIHPLVDLYHAVSLRNLTPAGAFDLDAIQGDVELRITRYGDRFTALDAGQPEAVPPGEVAYTGGSVVLTRHVVWRQAREGLVGPETRDAIVFSEVLGELEPDLAPRVHDDLRASIGRVFAPQGLVTAVLDEHSPELAW